MSVDYASGLSYYPNKGKCGQKERIDCEEDLDLKSQQLADLLLQTDNAVVITGAGISTAAGIPDFRGPNGVWTLESRGLKPQVNETFESAQPTITHWALTVFCHLGHVKYVVNQNIDGLFLKTGFPSDKIADVHGNIFVEHCQSCRARRVRSTPVPTMGLKATGNVCGIEKRGRCESFCRGKMHDTILDWEDRLPTDLLDRSESLVSQTDLLICLGTSLQIFPVASFPRIAKKQKHKSVNVVMVNLQATNRDKLADIRIFGKVDEIMKRVLFSINPINPTKTFLLNNLLHEKPPPLDIREHIFIKTFRKSSEDHLEVDKKPVSVSVDTQFILVPPSTDRSQMPPLILPRGSGGMLPLALDEREEVKRTENDCGAAAGL